LVEFPGERGLRHADVDRVLPLGTLARSDNAAHRSTRGCPARRSAGAAALAGRRLRRQRSTRPRLTLFFLVLLLIEGETTRRPNFCTRDASAGRPHVAGAHMAGKPPGA